MCQYFHRNESPGDSKHFRSEKVLTHKVNVKKAKNYATVIKTILYLSNICFLDGNLCDRECLEGDDLFCFFYQTAQS